MEGVVLMSSARVKEFPGQKAKVEVHFTDSCHYGKIIHVCDWISYENGAMILVHDDDGKNVFIPYNQVMCVLVSPVDKDVNEEEELVNFEL